MAIGVEVEMNQFPDNVSNATTAAAIESWLDTLAIDDAKTVYEISMEHKSGFWVVIIVYEA